MDIVQQLKRELALELCAMTHDMSGTRAPEFLGIHPSRIAELRRQDLKAFSLTRLLRLVVARGEYEVDLGLTPRKRAVIIPQPPTATVTRYDRFDNPIPRPTKTDVMRPRRKDMP